MRGRLALLLLLVPACERGDRVSVRITPDLVTLDQIGAQDTLVASATDARERPVSGAPVRWRSQDPTVALVSEGVVTAAGDGITRVWAVVGRDSAFVVVAVQPAQPPAPVARLELAPVRIELDALNATQLLSIRAQTADTAAVTTCGSDDPQVAAVDTTYTVTSLSEGVTRIRCRLVDAEASVRVAIRQQPVRAAIAGRGRTLRLGRDTLRLALARVDRLNSPLPPAAARWRSLDTSVVWVDAVTGTATGKALGSARVVGVFEDLSDTTALRVIDPNPPRFGARTVMAPARTGGRGGAGSAAGGGTRQAGGAAGRTAGTAPAFQARLGVRDIRDTDSIFRAPGAAGQQSARWTLSLFGEQAEHRVDFGLGLETERRSGLLFGGELRIAPFRRFEARIRGFSGELAARTLGALDASVGEGQVELGVNPFGWLWLHLGAAVRGYRDRFAAQQWRALRTGFELRLPLSEGAMHAVLQTTLLPVVRVSDLASPELGVITAGGLEYRTGRLATAALYGLERYDFPEVAGSRRREQFAGLRLRFGVQLGR